MSNVSSLHVPAEAPAQRAKWSFVTRRVDRSQAVRLLPHTGEVETGDLVLAEVARIGSHKRLQLSNGRFSPLWPGDRVVLACADRFAVDQFEGRAALPTSGADLLAGGGIIGEVASKNGKLAPATRLTVLGRLAKACGTPINLAEYARAPAGLGSRPPVIGVLGTGMNAGKTAAAAGVVNGFSRLGRRVTAIKATGTGAFGDLHEYDAAGADQVLDFTDAGLPSTYRQPIARVKDAVDLLLGHAATSDVAVVELADGVSQVETATLLSSPGFAARFDLFLLAAPDAMAVQGGLAWLGQHRIVPALLTGLMTRAPLAAAEATRSTGLPVLCRRTLADPATASALEGLVLRTRRSAA
ncbi:MAG: DUF1611 domain-containing protein [Pseudomonadota bacterium]